MKKRNILVFTIAAVTLFAAGCGNQAPGSSAGSSSENTESSSVSETTTKKSSRKGFLDVSCNPDKDFTSTSLETDISDLIIKSGDEDSVSGRIPDSYQLICYVKDDTLVVKEELSEKNRKKIIHIEAGRTGHVTVTLSRNNYEKFAASSDSGDLKMTDFGNVKAEDMELTVASGDVQASGLDADTLRLTSDSGELHASGLNASILKMTSDSGDLHASGLYTDNLSIRNNSGDTSIKDSAIGKSRIVGGSGEIFINSTNLIKESTLSTEDGDIRTDAATLEDTKISSSSGDIVLKGADSAPIQDVDLSTDSGEIRVKPYAEYADYNYDISCSSGDVRIGDEYYEGAQHLKFNNGADHTLKIRSDSGDCSISFLK